ncbi:MAG: 3-hydroxyacyl-CoA dehydrogenase NAD-binding domain-containing protein [Polyangiaceae bacterium]|nr:3-hydroxyacyl-CoA dehydrogenase NAD-binding domain-containing protein [Polyangiaceae bacterium]
MSVEQIKTVCVVGAGQMGGGIAQVCATAGYRVLLSDISLERAEVGRNKVVAQVRRLVEKATLTAEVAEQIEARLIATAAGLSEADLIIEAATENVELKLQLLRNADAAAQPHAILATNTSSISITRLASVTSRPAQVVGLHFMNPVPLMKLVEIVRGLETSDATLATARALSLSLGKEVIVSRDHPGFVVNRMLVPLVNEAIFALQEDLATVSDIDQGARLGLNHPMGPLELADLIGLDTVLAITEVLQSEFGDTKYRASTLLRNMVAAGRLGKKSRRGFYDYDERGKKLGEAPLFGSTSRVPQ